MQKKKLILPILIWLTMLCVFAGILLRPNRVLLFCLAGLLSSVIVLELLSGKQKERWARVSVRVFSLLLASMIAMLAILEGHIISYGKTDDTTPVSAMVILGAGVNGTEPSLSLRTRLEAALAYLSDKQDIPIIVTGSKGRGETISEAECMKNWLCEHGVAPERIYLEEQAENTKENVFFSQEMLCRLGIDTTDNIAVVTSDYHLYRTSLYWGTPWMVPVAASLSVLHWELNVNYYLREAFAIAKLLVFGGLE